MYVVRAGIDNTLHQLPDALAHVACIVDGGRVAWTVRKITPIDVE